MQKNGWLSKLNNMIQIKLGKLKLPEFGISPDILTLVQCMKFGASGCPENLDEIAFDKEAMSANFKKYMKDCQQVYDKEFDGKKIKLTEKQLEKLSERESEFNELNKEQIEEWEERILPRE